MLNNTIIKLDVINRKQFKFGSYSNRKLYELHGHRSGLILNEEELLIVHELVKEQVDKIKQRKEADNENS